MLESPCNCPTTQVKASNAVTRTCILLWVPWRPDSENKIRVQHWTKNRSHSLAAKEVWLSAVASSPAAIEFWTTTMPLLDSNPSGMPSPGCSDSTMPMAESDSSMANAEPMAKKEQSSELKG